MTAAESGLDASERRPTGDARFGWWAALTTGVTTLIAFAVAIGTPPLSGPFCKAGCYAYPYLDVASRYPHDYYWMFPAIVATLLFVAFAVALGARAMPEWRLLARFGVALGQMAALTIVSAYFLQLAVIQPSLIAREADGVSLLTQYNPHGVFIALEELGYLLLSASLACLGASLSGQSRLERAVRWLFVGGWVVCLAASLWFVISLGHERSYLLEIAVISIAWLSLVPGALMMALVFRRDFSRGVAR